MVRSAAATRGRRSSPSCAEDLLFEGSGHQQRRAHILHQQPGDQIHQVWVRHGKGDEDDGSALEPLQVHQSNSIRGATAHSSMCSLLCCPCTTGS